MEIAAMKRDGFPSINQYIDVIIGKEYAPTSINNKRDVTIFFLKKKRN